MRNLWHTVKVFNMYSIAQIILKVFTQAFDIYFVNGLWFMVECVYCEIVL